ncbi:SDR family NAD(P)-dependent oxidoreductase [Fodinicola acaciae]|uniref:SDR family NAD(P)-dependent oxidoreductase n=1 Tax=Fodinicola acaciae TaxID=2681555 RepID=UPI0013D3A340|nr:SDR family oxidoreductase [Fodinicola acaciae]
MPLPYTSALVTGASSGIGAAMARLLAGAGVDLVLVARSTGKLDQLAAELTSRHGVEVEVLPADLSDARELARVEARLGDPSRPLDLLVNNAAASTFGPFADIGADESTRLLQLNTVAPMRLTRAALPLMVKRQRGWILLVSSLGALQPAPLFAVYTATKAFLTNFGESLHEELRDKSVVVTVAMPGFTRTEMGSATGVGETGASALLWDTPENVARAALTACAYGRATVVPGALNSALSTATRLTPRTLVRRLAGIATGRMKSA